RDDYSTSNKGEKTENGDTSDVNQNGDSVIRNAGSVNHPEPSADQNEPEVPEAGPESPQPEPVTRIADGVFDVSAFFADTSNQGEKTEVTPPDNDDRSHECAEEKVTETPATMELLLRQIADLQEKNNQLLEAGIAYQERAVAGQEKLMAALVSGTERFICTMTGADNNEK
ncbi:hypothetical protein MOR33_005056, partial [Salmonella enterica]|nr:hypothetical protein [Salmonella enterica]EIZ2336007.1 hypothetical protein [Salmonella enterica]